MNVYIRCFTRPFDCSIPSATLQGMIESSKAGDCFVGIKLTRGTEVLYVGIDSIDATRTFTGTQDTDSVIPTPSGN